MAVAIDEVRPRMAAAASGIEADDLFRVFWRWHEERAEAIGLEFLEKQDLQEALSYVRAASSRTVWNHPLSALRDLPAGKRNEIRRSAPGAFEQLECYERAGFDFAYGEGTWYLQSDGGVIAGLAELLPGEGLKAYARFTAVESEQAVTHDAGLVMTWDELRQRLARWEAFQRQHANLPEATGAIAREIRMLAGLFLFGCENTPIFESGTVPPELRRSYARFLEVNQDSTYYPAVRAGFEALQKSMFRPTPAYPAALRRTLPSVEDFEERLRWLEGQRKSAQR